jgi:hypothetical protein
LRSLELPKPQKSAKQFLKLLVPDLLEACGVKSEQSFLGFKVNIQGEAEKRISAMQEKDARHALETLKELLKAW